MIKNSRNNAVDLKKRQSYINLEEINMVSCITIATVVLILVLSAAIFASYPNSNMPLGV